MRFDPLSRSIGFLKEVESKNAPLEYLNGGYDVTFPKPRSKQQTPGGFGARHFAERAATDSAKQRHSPSGAGFREA